MELGIVDKGLHHSFPICRDHGLTRTLGNSAIEPCSSLVEETAGKWNNSLVTSVACFEGGVAISWLFGRTVTLVVNDESFASN